MTKLAAVFLFAGFLLVFGAVGGMDDPTKADYFWHQLAAAATGLFWMFIGAAIMPREQDSE